MVWKIRIGNWDNRYSNIFLSIIFKILCQCFYGMNNNEVFKTIKFFKKSTLSDNILIHYCFNYFFISLIWFCYNLYNYCINKKTKKNINNNKPTKSLKLIQYDAESKRKTNKEFLIIFFVCVFWVIEEFCMQCFIVFFKDIDIWMVELFIYSLLNKFIFKQNIYRHQWLAIYISFGSLILKIISIIMTKCGEDFYKFEDELPILYVIKWEVLIFGTFFYLILIAIRASINIGLKWIMEKIYTPINKILFLYGSTGFIISFICIFLSSIKECNTRFSSEYNIPNNTNFNYSNYFCKAIDNTKFNISNNNTNSSEYLTYYKFYFNNWKSFWEYELIAIFSWAIAFFFFKYYSLKIIKILSPAHFIFSIPIEFFFEKLINIFYELNQFKFFETTEQFKKKKFYLDIGGDIITIIGLLIYLEIIVFQFCGFDYNLKNNIIRRASLDINNNNLDETIYSNINENEGLIDNENNNVIENVTEKVNENENQIESQIENKNKET